MTGARTTYVPFDYIRLCDICGNRKNRSQLHKQDNLMVCNDHPGERLAPQLSRLNAKQKPFRTLPIPNAKPEDKYAPDTFEAEEAETLAFVTRAMAGRYRYETVASGDRAALAATRVERTETAGWAARYAYALIVEARRPSRLITQAKALLKDAADYLFSQQAGFGIAPTLTKSNNYAFGEVLGTNSLAYSEIVALAGLAMIYAYRVFGTGSYLAAARGAACYLRNVQSIGSHLSSHFTSSDAAGAVRLYTGGITSTISGVGTFTTDHRFYPSSLLALQTWSELLATDGDQMIGSDTTAGAFASAPQQLISQSITDLRAFWTSGTFDATSGTTYTGFSADTPREFFNAYPAAKTDFPTVTGTGSWEFSDAGASTGTLITSQNYAKALAALMAYEGASSQVTAVNSWLRSFASNPTTETPANTSASALARSQTGTYDPTATLATTLTVRDAAASYVASKINDSSLYDWGAFGLLSPIWSASYSTTFASARLEAVKKRRRYNDGLPMDWQLFDRASIRGRSGLSYQTTHTDSISGVSVVVSDAVTAAQFGAAFRYGPRAFSVPL